eukprot:scaffold99086_cov69-Phaeocystis_antarctica.AAC.2
MQPSVCTHRLLHPELAPRTGWHAPSAPSLQAPRAPDSPRGSQAASGQMCGTAGGMPALVPALVRQQGASEHEGVVRGQLT